MTDIDKEIKDAKDDAFKGLEPIASAPIAPAHGIAAIALNMALKYHDIGTVQDGALYQQYKLEGKNLTPLHFDMVLETATQIEKWLLGASDRIAELLVEAIEVSIEEDKKEEKKGKRK